MNKKSLSQEEILQASCEIIREKGLVDLNMREVASRTHVALGSIYNYFPSKNDLLIAVIGSIWKEIMASFNKEEHLNDFINYISCLFKTISTGKEQYPDFFTMHAIHFSNSSKDKGRVEMEHYLEQIKAGMYESLLTDSRIKKDLFNHELSASALIDFVFDNMMTALVKGNKNIDLLLYIISSTLYDQCS